MRATLAALLTAILLGSDSARAQDALAYKQRAFASKSFAGGLRGTRVSELKASGAIVWTPGDQRAYEYALECRRVFAAKVPSDRPYLLLANYSLQGEAPRLRVFNVSDPADPGLLLETHVGHGEGNISSKERGWEYRAPRAAVTTDQKESQALSAGCFRVHGLGGRVFASAENADLYGWHLEGLEERNKCAEERVQKLHQQGRDRVDDTLGMRAPSHGCMNLSNEGYKRLLVLCADPLKRETCVINAKGVILANYHASPGEETPAIVPSRTARSGLAAACRQDRAGTRRDVSSRKRPYPRREGPASVDFGPNVEVEPRRP